MSFLHAFYLTYVADADSAAGEALPEFKKPEKWTAPYAMYTPGWWEKFYPTSK